MPIVSSDCPKCGAPLNVDTGARFIHCSHCQAQLEVQDGGGELLRESVAVMQDTARITQNMAAATAEASERQVAMIRLNHVQTELKKMWNSSSESAVRELKWEESRLLDAVGGMVEPVPVRVRNNARGWTVGISAGLILFGLNLLTAITIPPVLIVIVVLVLWAVFRRRTLV
jgi:LSD1 subclass zinc finger protein